MNGLDCRFCGHPVQSDHADCDFCRECYWGGRLFDSWGSVLPEGFTPWHTGGGCWVMGALVKDVTIYIVNAWPGDEEDFYGDALSNGDEPGEFFCITAYRNDEYDQLEDEPWFFRNVPNDRTAIAAAVSEIVREVTT